MFGPLAAALTLALTIGGCTAVQSDVRRRAESELASRGLAGVTMDVGYRDVTLTGPPGLQQEAVGAIEDLTAPRAVRYVAEGGSAGAVATSTTSPASISPTTVAPASPVLELTGSLAGGAITLEGQVPDAATRDDLVEAAAAAFGAENVTDRLMVGGTVPTSELSAAATALAGLIGSLAEDLDGGTFRLTGTDLTVSGTAPTVAAADRLEAGLSGVAGLSVRADIGVAPGGVAVAGIADLLATQQITFDSGSDRITAEGSAILDEIAPLLRHAFAADPALTIEIGGHTDDQGDESANLDLSTRRAEAVRAALADLGVPAERLSIAGYGESRPIADNTTSAGRAANRRIEFTIVEG